MQRVLEQVGSVHNLSLARLASQKRILFVEGEDVAILKRFQNALSPGDPTPVDTLPHSDIGGRSGWQSVLLLADFFRKNKTDSLAIHCVLDRDYFLEEEVDCRIKEAKDRGVRLHVWRAKEVENYLIMSGPIARAVAQRLGQEPDVAMVSRKIDELADEMYDDTFDKFSESARNVRKGEGLDKANKVARTIMRRWSQEKLYMVGGKDLLRRVCRWSQESLRASISPQLIMHHMTKSDIDEDVIGFFSMLNSEH